MDGIDIRKSGKTVLKKYRYVALIFLVGMFLMLMPESSEAPQSSTAAEPIPEMTLQTSLENILSNIEGAGKTQVLLTQAQGERTLYQTDDDISNGEKDSDHRKETVIITDSAREEKGLVIRTDPPIYQGAVILCQGAEKPKVRLSIVEAVSNATGLSTDKITVLKMK